MSDATTHQELCMTRKIVRLLEDTLLVFSIDVRRKGVQGDFPLPWKERDPVSMFSDEERIEGVRSMLQKACREQVVFLRLLFDVWGEWRTQLEIQERDYEKYGALLDCCDQ